MLTLPFLTNNATSTVAADPTVALVSSDDCEVFLTAASPSQLLLLLSHAVPVVCSASCSTVAAAPVIR